MICLDRWCVNFWTQALSEIVSPRHRSWLPVMQFTAELTQSVAYRGLWMPGVNSLIWIDARVQLFIAHDKCNLDRCPGSFLDFHTSDNCVPILFFLNWYDVDARWIPRAGPLSAPSFDATASSAVYYWMNEQLILTIQHIQSTFYSSVSQP